jgi:hypothetical protein
VRGGTVLEPGDIVILVAQQSTAAAARKQLAG